ncbi:MAG: aminoacyl-tRNA hydrolase [Acidobacteriota bacterium]
MPSDESSSHPEGRLVLGLGNPGEDYAATRHNLGFRVVDELARRRGLSPWRLECNSLVATEGEVFFAKPLTYMNRSGHAARCLVERHGFARDAVLVIYDEVHLPLGRLRLRPAGSPAGHRGMESVIAGLRSDGIARLRLGVAQDDAAADLVSFVLAPFDEDEQERVEKMIERAADACEGWLEGGVAAAMNRFNG